jgi:ubiquinone/menaquinone biosynthesis C-methylase UbiE
VDPGVNQRIFDEAYTPEQLDIRAQSALDRGMVELRQGLVRRYGHGHDVLDVGCGSGAYLRPHLPHVRSAVALDFSEKMLGGLSERLGDPPPDHVRLVKADARAMPLADATVDLAFSFTTLYLIPQADRAIAEMARVLRPGGHAILELGALWSLTTVISFEQHRDTGSARPYHLPYRALLRHVRDAGLDVVEWRSFQLVPMYGAPRRLRTLAPLFHPRWKAIAGRRVRGRMLDERAASMPFLRPLAFRHMVVARKP